MTFLQHPSAETVMPELPQSDENDTIKTLKKLILLKVMRPDRFMASAK
jgi:hypothetical protein